MPQGLFVTFEGLDGSGKSTQLRKLSAWLSTRGEPVVTTRQPGGTPFGDRIRALLLDSRSDGLEPLAELGLMFSDRVQTIAQVIRPLSRPAPSSSVTASPIRRKPTRAVGASWGAR